MNLRLSIFKMQIDVLSKTNFSKFCLFKILRLTKKGQKTKIKLN